MTNDPKPMTKKNRNAPESSGKSCEAPGCREAGDYKAPRSFHRLNDYVWFCLDHVREYNKAWDYFKNMKSRDIESFMKEAVIGHRPTWRMGQQPIFTRESLKEKLEEFLRFRIDNPAPIKRRETPETKALALFGLAEPVTVKEVKARYKKLAREHHPDVNKGSKAAEEQFKRVTEAYRLLLAHYA